jgi:hypothetical protein
MRTIKTLGIVTAMALALIAFVGASAASANLFKTAIEPTTWNGSLTGKSHVLSLNGESFTCEKVSFSGEVKTKTTNEVTVTPELSSCAHEGFSTTWAMNGCKFRLRPGAGPSLVGSVDITGCSSPMSLTTVYGCTTQIGNQPGLGTVTYKNVATSPTTVTAIASLTGLTFTRSGTGCSGPKGTFSNGAYTGEWTIKGASVPGGAPTAVEVESSVAPFTHFSAEEAPVTIAGTDTRAGSFKRFVSLSLGGDGGGVYCSSYTLSGTSATASPEAVTLTPKYAGCTLGGEAVPDSFVSAGGCSYAFHANGTLDIVGATCASNPMTFTRAGCVATVGPQSGLYTAGFSYTNGGSGKSRSVSMSGSTGEKLTYTSTGAGCSKQGTFSNSLLHSTSTLTAKNSKGESQGISIE